MSIGSQQRLDIDFTMLTMITYLSLLFSALIFCVILFVGLSKLELI